MNLYETKNRTVLISGQNINCQPLASNQEKGKAFKRNYCGNIHQFHFLIITRVLLNNTWKMLFAALHQIFRIKNSFRVNVSINYPLPRKASDLTESQKQIHFLMIN